MNIVNLQQGSPEWLAHRANHFNASDAPAMMGCSPYKTRDQLLHEMHTGLTPTVSPEQQSRFDDGHRFEALARPLAEKIIDEELYPVVGSVGKLSASFDGLTLMYDVGFEHKSLNNDLRECMEGMDESDRLPLHYRVQMEQQLHVSGAERILFMASKWNGDTLVEERHCWYYPDMQLRAKILAGWEQFAADLAAYVPTEKAAPVVAAVQESLPAVSVRVNGALAIVSNLPDFGQALREFIAKIPERPSTDQEFADTEAACKSLKRAEEALEAAENNALAQLADVDTMRRLVADFKALAKATRLQREKLVAQRKEQIREEVVMEGRRALNDHMAALNARLGKPWMPSVVADFAGAIKGKRTVDSLRDAVNTTLANAKIEANQIADRIQINLNTLRDLASEHGFLFADASTIVLKAADDLTMLVKARIAEHQQAEAARLEAERERIRKEEAARLEQEARAKKDAQLRAARALADEEAARRERKALATEAKRIEAERDHHAAQQTSLVPPIAPVLVDKAEADANACQFVDRVEVLGRQAAQFAEQVDMVKAAREAEPATLKLGDICARLGITMTAAFVADTLGIKPSGQDKRAVLFKESDFGRICDALSRHALQTKAGELMAA